MADPTSVNSQITDLTKSEESESRRGVTDVVTETDFEQEERDGTEDEA